MSAPKAFKTRAAGFAGMSRESACRFCERFDGALFALAWDRALEGHTTARCVTRAELPLARFSRGNSPKVAKWKKWKDPRFQAIARELCDVRDGYAGHIADT